MKKKKKKKCSVTAIFLFVRTLSNHSTYCHSAIVHEIYLFRMRANALSNRECFKSGSNRHFCCCTNTDFRAATNQNCELGHIKCVRIWKNRLIPMRTIAGISFVFEKMRNFKTFQLIVGKYVIEGTFKFEKLKFAGLFFLPFSVLLFFTIQCFETPKKSSGPSRPRTRQLPQPIQRIWYFSMGQRSMLIASMTTIN